MRFSKLLYHSPMNTPTLIRSRSPRAVAGLLPLTLSLLTPVVLSAQNVAPLGLPRLAEQARVGEAAPVARDKFTAEALVSPGAVGARSGEKRGAKFLALDAAHDWFRPLRGGAKETGFVSFSVYGSIGTIIEAGGARLGIVDSDIDGYAQLAVDENSKWRLLGIHVPLQKFEGKFLGRFPVLTLRLDRSDGSWDLFHSARLVAEDLPIDASIKHAQFVVKAGEEGAMINGLVQSDVNPLYADDNGNGVDDSFEQQKRGRLLAKADGKADRKQLIADWRKHQRTSPPPALFVNLPRPD